MSREPRLPSSLGKKTRPAAVAPTSTQHQQPLCVFLIPSATIPLPRPNPQSILRPSELVSRANLYLANRISFVVGLLCLSTESGQRVESRDIEFVQLIGEIIWQIQKPQQLAGLC
jgi:hypothetical protein